MCKADEPFLTRIHRGHIACLALLPIHNLRERHLATGRMAHTCEYLDQFGLPVALDTGNTEDLPRVNIETDAVQDLQIAVGLCVQVFDVKHDRSRVSGSLID